MNGTEDDLVDRVLQSLRDTEPPQGMESRIMDALRRRGSPMPAQNRSLWKVAPLAGTIALASVACVLLFTVHRRTPQAFAPQPQALSAQTAGIPVALQAPAARITSKRTAHTVQVATALPRKVELAPASYPAPPMPLTEQEKLLLRLAHQGDPVQLAMLDPVQREANYADERAQVQRFFTPSKQEITREP